MKCLRKDQEKLCVEDNRREEHFIPSSIDFHSEPHRPNPLDSN